MTKYNFEFKKKVVLEYINENISIRSLVKKYDIKSHNNIEILIAKYKKYGDEGLYRSRKNEEYPFEKKIYVVELYLTSELSYNDLALQDSYRELKLAIEKYIKYYNEERIKEKLGWLSPKQYRIKHMTV